MFAAIGTRESLLFHDSPHKVTVAMSFLPVGANCPCSHLHTLLLRPVSMPLLAFPETEEGTGSADIFIDPGHIKHCDFR